MKRADQHTNSNGSSVQADNDNIIQSTEENGIDMPSEKPGPVQDSKTPGMGALPVDTLGSGRSVESWKSGGADETHEMKEDVANEDVEDEDSLTGEKNISIGSGPDPENIDI